MLRRYAAILLTLTLVLSGLAGCDPHPVTPPLESTHSTTEPVTIPTTQPTTEPVTEPPTEPTTEPTTEPATEPATEPPTEPAAPEKPEEEGPDSMIGLALIGVAVSCFALGALIFGRRRPAKKGKGRYSR